MMDIPNWMPEVYRRQSMALNPMDRDQWIQEHGPYLEHWTTKENVPKILQEGLKPPEYTDDHFNDMGEMIENPHQWGGFLQTRPDHVYLAKPGFISPGMHETAEGTRPYQVPVRVDLRKLDPTNLKADEDWADWHWEDWEQQAEPDTRDWMQENPPPTADMWEPETQTRGDWANKVGLDDEPWTADSLQGGSVAHEGPIPPEAISLHPDYDKNGIGQWNGQEPYRFGRIRHMSGGDWFCPAYGIPDDVKEQIHEWGKTLPWDESAKIQDPSKYHITSFYSPHGFSDPTHHQWVTSRSGLTYPAYTHSLDTFTGQEQALSPVVMRFHAPELSAHAEQMMNEGEQRGLGVARFDGGHKPHITLGHNPEGFPVQPPHIEFQTTPMHELHTYYDSLKR